MAGPWRATNADRRAAGRRGESDGRGAHAALAAAPPAARRARRVVGRYRGGCPPPRRGTGVPPETAGAPRDGRRESERTHATPRWQPRHPPQSQAVGACRGSVPVALGRAFAWTGGGECGGFRGGHVSQRSGEGGARYTPLSHMMHCVLHRRDNAGSIEGNVGHAARGRHSRLPREEGAGASGARAADGSREAIRVHQLGPRGREVAEEEPIV